MQTSARTTGDDDRKIGERIRVARLRAGLSQTALAEQLGVTFQQVQKYEKGVNRVAAGRLVAISRVLDVDVSYFIPEDAIREGSLGLSDEEAHLLTLFAQIRKPKLRRAVIALAQTLAEGD